MFQPCNYLPHSMFYLYVIFFFWLVYFREIKPSFLMPASELLLHPVGGQAEAGRVPPAPAATADVQGQKHSCGGASESKTPGFLGKS